MTSLPPPSPLQPGRPDTTSPYGASASPTVAPASSPYGEPDPYRASTPYRAPDPYGASGPAWDHPRPEAFGKGRSLPGQQDPAPGTDMGTDLKAALDFAWKGLTRNPVPFLVSGGVYFLLVVIIGLSAFVVPLFVLIGSYATEIESGAVDPVTDLGFILLVYALIILMMLPMAPLMWLWQSGAARSSEIIRAGGRPTIGQAFVGPMRIILTMLLAGAIVFVGLLLFYIPGLIAAVLLSWAMPAAARGAGPVEAVKQSAALVKGNLGTTIVASLVIGGIGYLASFLILPIIALLTFSCLYQMGVFERLNGRELPEPAAA